MTSSPRPPVIILVEPQLGENIGLVARVMANFGVHDLRLVRPRDPWPNPNAIQSSAGAYELLHRTRLYPDLDAAIADCHHVCATTVRPRHLEKKVATPRVAFTGLDTPTWGILFGPENAGLSNEDISKANDIITIPTIADFGSLNLSHAVAICCYEWKETQSIVQNSSTLGPLATKEEVTYLLTHLETALDKKGFFLPTHKRDKMIWNLRSIFQRVALTDQEVRTLRGVIKALSGE